MVCTWLGVVIVAIIVEMIVPGLVAIWFVPSALIAMLLAAFKLPIPIQIIVFLVLSVLFIFLSRKLFSGKKRTRTNIDAVIGSRCVVTEKINNLAGSGKVKLNGMDWTARASDETSEYDIGDIVTVTAVEGVKLIIK